MILSCEEMAAQVNQIIVDVCAEEGIEYDDFISAFNKAWGSQFEDREA